MLGNIFTLARKIKMSPLKYDKYLFFASSPRRANNPGNSPTARLKLGQAGGQIKNTGNSVEKVSISTD